MRMPAATSVVNSARSGSSSCATTSTLGAASATMAAISHADRRQFRPAITAPTWLQANISSSISAQFLDSTATRSPGRTPAANSALAACPIVW